MIKLNIDIKNENLNNVLGELNKNLKTIKHFFNTEIIVNHDGIYVKDALKAELIEKVFTVLFILSSNKISFRERDVSYISSLVDKMDISDITDFYISRKEIIKNYSGKPLYPKTISQDLYLKELDKNDLILSIGPAGVGKTYVACLDAIRRFKRGEYTKIILSRPIVEAGESLGYLPGEIKEKVDPYLIPLYDCLYELLSKRVVDEYIENGLIEIAPLAYMRGRTLENSYIILDEAQNATISQMKLFLTRLGFNAKMVVTGDLSQTDLKNKNDSGLNYAVKRLNDIPGIKIIEFDKLDVVRNPLVQKIIERFEDD